MIAVLPTRCERLPIRLYTTADGLPSNVVGCVVRDSRNFLWFCTNEGLSRFDGYTFTNYGSDEGLPDRAIAGFLETRDGEYWVATAHALARFHHEAGSAHRFDVYWPPDSLSQQASEIAEAPDGRIWYLTNQALFLFNRLTGQFEGVDLGRRKGQWDTLFQDQDRSIWVGGESTLKHRLADGRIEDYGEAEGLPVSTSRVRRFLRDREGRLWAATWNGLYKMVPQPALGKRSVERVFRQRDGLPADVVFTVFQSRDGRLWAATEGGLGELIRKDGKSLERFRGYTSRSGFELPGTDGPWLVAIAEDESANLWMVGEGAMRMAAGGFTHYTVQDGLRTNGIASIFEDRDRRLIVISVDPRSRFLHVLEAGHFFSCVPLLPAGLAFTWGSGQIHFQDHTGIWWVATSGGLCRYPRVKRIQDLARTLPERVFTRRDGLPGDSIFRLFEDSRGDVWISILGATAVARWSRGNGAIQTFACGEDGKPLGTPTAFAEDRQGGVWMGFYYGGLARYAQGRFRVFPASPQLPGGGVRTLYFDHLGRLWLATNRGGLLRIDRPECPQPVLNLYSTRSGLSSNDVRVVTEDSSGRIYVGTGHGVDQLNPETGSVRHYSRADGLGFLGDTNMAFRDHNGVLWFGQTGLSRFVPRPDSVPTAPPIRIIRVATRGRAQPISELGQSHFDGLRLSVSQTPIEIGFSSLSFGAGETMRYQYRLEGSEWSEPTTARAVTYAVLLPGAYRFQVRAVTWDGRASETPASLTFRILPPWWRSGWFLALLVVVIGSVVLLAHRYRLQQVLELERVRTRIATDLHDDIGSSLTQIAILSEVARKNAAGDRAEVVTALARIADLSRDLVDSMSDIVWAINPRRDHLTDLAYRMRRFAGDVFTARQIRFRFTAPPAGIDAVLSTGVRRQVFLIFKECVNNVARHSHSSDAEVVLRTEDHRLILSIRDNGCGFDIPLNGQGHGISSMHQRARELGADFDLASQPGLGTTAILSLPLRRRVHKPKVTT